MFIAKLINYKSPGSEQIAAELHKAGGEILPSVTHKLINYIWNKEECLISGRSPLLNQIIKSVIKLPVIMILGITTD
jgi:hypothetical protein